jgi:hypothetical protein
MGYTFEGILEFRAVGIMLSGGWEDKALQECNLSAHVARGLRMHPPPGLKPGGYYSPLQAMAKARKLIPHMA